MTPPSPKKDKKQVEKAKNTDDIHRTAFLKQLTKTRKPLLDQKTTNPTPIDITNEETIAKYIASEDNTD